jgi:hypothetical protein
VALLPSTRDIAADGEIGAEGGCIGRDLNDSTPLVSGTDHPGGAGTA